MAYTVSREHSTLGNKKVAFIKISADAATQTVESGMKVIDAFSVGPISMTTITDINIAYNSNASGVQSMGVFGISGATNGDVFFIVAYGH